MSSKIKTLSQAASEGDLDSCLVHIRSGSDLSAPGDPFNALHCSPLMSALHNSHEEVALALIKAGADVNALDITQETALHCAARVGLVSVCKALLKRGAKIDALSFYGEAPLHLAASCDHPDVCELLIAQGADVNHAATSRHGENKTPLHRAMNFPTDSIAAIRVLLDHGANIHLKNKDGDTPLQMAAKKGYTKACLELLERGADPLSKSAGCTVTGLASRYKHSDTSAQIKAWMAANKARQAIDAISALPQVRCT
jgi:ankyrin repeat protein